MWIKGSSNEHYWLITFRRERPDYVPRNESSLMPPKKQFCQETTKPGPDLASRYNRYILGNTGDRKTC